MLMVFLGVVSRYSFYIFCEILKNRKNRRAISKQLSKEKDPKFVLKSIRGGDIFDPKDLDTFFIISYFNLKTKTIKNLKSSRKFKTFQINSENKKNRVSS